MFGAYIVINKNEIINKVDFQIQDDAYFQSANRNGVVIIKTPLARAYINEDSFFGNIPESAWESAFEGEMSPRETLESKIGQSMDDDAVLEFQKLINDLINAEINSKDI